MEIRNALNQGTPSLFLKSLSEDLKLRSILRLADNRMEDRELYLRAYAFINTKYLYYEKPLTTFLDKAMESIYKKTKEGLEEISRKIIDAIVIQSELFGRHIFSKSILGNTNKIILNSALFEVWVSLVYFLDGNEKRALLSNSDILIKEYKILLRNEAFVKSITTSTASNEAVRTRFEGVKK
ncbi:hypothetical protein FSB73_22485 [Arachidicoccus ginsenosidivorans]|uniref:Uncharacterized protein n=1 Tax=Arachidicoccus ginsenosidivorans TaxID=496057 RepID=A0A5B8VTD1_9BACT|nr:hypothetical protein [Arachidicoccus ginsenosidivorans]QEC74026.1 hypothetical protein FSB73_22485 [Arachidicoccus ginsenosidivorans]